MTDADLFALCIWDEAANQPYEGMVAVSRVIHNRIAQLYESDGTVAGTILRYDQFSGFYFEMAGGSYERVCSTPEAAAARAETLLPPAQRSSVWLECQRAVTDGDPAFTPPWSAGVHPQWDLLAAEPRALLYVNRAVSSPAWATPETHIAKIFAHDFYRA